MAIKTITSVFTYMITSIEESPIEDIDIAILVIMSVSTFETTIKLIYCEYFDRTFVHIWSSK